ncbi:MAG: ABC transporter ATP-binding protein [Acidobacteriota bacterium]|nr:ABC transporter ATP-binding protein [Acidobacteriota bacterium]
MTRPVRELCWPQDRLAEATFALARAAGLYPRTGVSPHSPHGDDDWKEVNQHLEDIGEALDIRLQCTQLSWPTMEATLARCGPAVLRQDLGEEIAYLTVLGANGKKLRVLDPAGGISTCLITDAARLIMPGKESRHITEIDRLLEEAEVPEKRRAAARHTMLADRMGINPLNVCWTLEMKPGKSVTSLLSHYKQWGSIRRILLGFVAAYVAGLVAWYLIGKGALEGRIDHGWLWPWALLVLFQGFIHVRLGWLQGHLSIQLGALIKRKLLEHTFAVDHETIRRQGMGQLMGKIFDTENIQAFALNGGFLAALAVVELILAASVIALGTGGGTQLLLFIAWLLLVLGLCGRFWKMSRKWTLTRLDMTHDLIERMAGHRTRLAQENRTRRHDTEDRILDGYLNDSRAMDRVSLIFSSLAMHGWTVLALAGLAPYLVGGASGGALAVALGGILLASGAFANLNAGFTNMVGFFISWEQLKPIFSGRAEELPPPPPIVQMPGGSRLDARDIGFAYPTRPRAVLDGCNLRIDAGDRVLLTGPSGGGKSTLAGILCGLRKPASGVLLFGGLDRPTLGARTWRRRIALAPQFHENMIFSETLGYNLLMGRAWPPRPGDMQLADAVCRELGLGDLIERMPSGYNQMVGEIGWKLSHGERNRIFLARALLQEPDILVLDESFAALDPANLNLVFDCVLKRAKTLVVIAHP